VVPGGVRQPERFGAADEAEAAHRARLGAGHVLEQPSEPRGGMRGERDAGGLSVAADDCRPG
jgi:hypothetical protein